MVQARDACIRATVASADLGEVILVPDGYGERGGIVGGMPLELLVPNLPSVAQSTEPSALQRQRPLPARSQHLAALNLPTTPLPHQTSPTPLAFCHITLDLLLQRTRDDIRAAQG
eukprot:1946287-Rhodomonas_salina.1